MKNVRLMVLATIAMMFMGVANLSAQEQDQQTVIIRVFEFYSGANSHMSVISPDGSTKSVQLSDLSLNMKYIDNEMKNGIALQSEIDTWKKKGFIVSGISNSNTPIGEGLVMVIILSK